jgi:hypothetical protein
MNYKISKILYGIFVVSILANCDQDHFTGFDIWYGEEQSFGFPGNPQRAINVLGNVSYRDSLTTLEYSLNGGEWQKLSEGADGRRLARQGDFNIEILRKDLQEGKNNVIIRMEDAAGNKAQTKILVNYTSGNTWPLPYEVDWNDVDELQKVTCITDGKWKLVTDGIRTVESYYDRMLAFGDSTWVDFEIETSVIFHDYAMPEPAPPTFGVSHAALAMRWPGHDDDGKQPRVKWYPLGATCEMQLKPSLDSCRWRILGGGSKTEDIHRLKQIELGKKYMMKSRVESQEDDSTLYSVKLWMAGQPEPGEWDLQAKEGTEDVQYGSGLLISHNTDVTFGNVKFSPIDKK